jgi:Hg(II)-responsive transcriptional regulator
MLNPVPTPRVKHLVMPGEKNQSLTIGRLAKLAGVGIETVRYYEQRGIIQQPVSNGAVRHYPISIVDRIRFVKRAQELGFSLDEITELLRLEDGAHRQAIRSIARRRLAQVETKLCDLQRIRCALKQMLLKCEEKGTDVPCPIIATFAGRDTP